MYVHIYSIYIYNTYSIHDFTCMYKYVCMHTVRVSCIAICKLILHVKLHVFHLVHVYLLIYTLHVL